MIQLPDPSGALTAECDELDKLLAGLDDEQWQLPTPAPGWTIAHQVAHLAATYRMAELSGTDPDGFVTMMLKLDNDFTLNVANALSGYLSDPPEVLFTRWQAQRHATVDALAALPADQILPWLVNPLPPPVLMMAGLMEAFAHGQDIADALGVRREPTARLRHVAHIGVRTRDFAYLVRDLTPPTEEFRVELMGPGNELWTWGPEDAAQRVTGPALEFCLLVSQRVHRADTALVAVGADAEAWLEIAQAFAGPPGKGREIGSRG